MKPIRVLSIGALGAGTYALALRPRFLRWGATEEESFKTLPGDDIVPMPRSTSTRAISIAADPHEVWPWLAQMGQGRGGLYSYDRLENLFGCNIHSADHIVPELQSISPGDRVRLVPDGSKVDLSFEVASVEHLGHLVLKAPGEAQDAFSQGLPYPSWAFVIEPVVPGLVRLIVRWRSDFLPTAGGYLWSKYAIEPIHFVMERKMMLGIKERAEALNPVISIPWAA